MTYYDWQITHSEVMSRVSRQARIPIHQRDSRVHSLSEFIEFRLSSSTLTELELKKLYRTWEDSDRASALELLWGLPISLEVFQSSEPRLSLLYKEWTWKHYRKLNLTFFTLSAERSRRVFIGGLSRCLGQNWGSGGPLVRPAIHLTWPGGQVLWQHCLSHIGYASCRLWLTHVEDGFQKDAKPWLASQGGLASRPPFCSVWPGLCATSSPCVILSATMSYFGHNEDMHGFWSIWYFSIIRCSWKGKSTKLVKIVSNKHLSSISWLKCRYVGDKYIHFWLPTIT
jgi:hypothetical protein